MDIKKALKVINRQRPCSHGTLAKGLGDGGPWVKCEDCGEAIERSSLMRYRIEAKEFDVAIGTIMLALKYPEA